MTRLAHLGSTSALLFCLAPAAMAELTAEDVWGDWEKYIESFGYTVEGRENRDGDSLVLSGVTITLDDGTDAATARIEVDRLVLTEVGDGTVTIDLPAVMPMTFSAPDIDGSTTQISMDYRQTGMTVTASGTPENIAYAYAAEQITFETTGMQVDGQLMPPEANDIEVILSTLAGTSTSQSDNGQRYEQNLSVDSLRYSIRAADVATGTRSDMSGQTEGLTFVGNSVLPEGASAQGDMASLLAAGMTANGTFAYGSNASTVLVTAPEGVSEITFVAQSGELAVEMQDGAVTYKAAQTGTQMAMNVPQSPFPINVDIASAAFNLTTPMVKTGEAQDVALGVTLDGFAVPEALWALVDPGALIPRDPATLVIDLTGKAKLLFDMLDPAETLTADPGQAPIEFENVTLNQIRISAAGAELTGSGAATIDNSAPDGPRPQGAVDLTLRGANGLIDKLIAAGLLPQEQAMGARMMMGLLAVPGSEPDTLNSRIEVNDQGHVLANGQRIQ